MSDRDELAMAIMHHPWLDSHEGLYTGLCPECPGRKISGGYNSPSHADHLADAILAAGYRKPRTITTIEELDALPSWTVVRSDEATIWEKFKGGYGSDFWAETMTLGKHPSSHIALPATVLHEGA